MANFWKHAFSNIAGAVGEDHTEEPSLAVSHLVYCVQMVPQPFSTVMERNLLHDLPGLNFLNFDYSYFAMFRYVWDEVVELFISIFLITFPIALECIIVTRTIGF